MKSKAKFAYNGKERLLECNLKAVAFSNSRNELIAVYKAAKKVFGDSPELKEIVEACKVRQEVLNNAKS